MSSTSNNVSVREIRSIYWFPSGWANHAARSRVVVYRLDSSPSGTCSHGGRTGTEIGFHMPVHEIVKASGTGFREIRYFVLKKSGLFQCVPRGEPQIRFIVRKMKAARMFQTTGKRCSRFNNERVQGHMIHGITGHVTDVVQEHADCLTGDSADKVDRNAAAPQVCHQLEGVACAAGTSLPSDGAEERIVQALYAE